MADEGSKDQKPAAKVVGQARQGLEQAESGDTKGADRLARTRKADPASTEAAEQEASDGPAGAGLAR